MPCQSHRDWTPNQFHWESRTRSGRSCIEGCLVKMSDSVGYLTPFPGKQGLDLQRNQYWSLSSPCTNVLFCRQVMHCFHFFPLLVVVKSPSSQTISEAVVLDEFGSDQCSVDESMHTEEQGEFGATWTARTT